MSSSPSRKKAPPSEEVEENILMLTKGEVVSVDQLITASPVQIPNRPCDQAAAFFNYLYKPEELVAVVAAECKAMGKTAPLGKSCVTEAQKLVRYVSGGGVEVLFSQFGGYSRINPVKSQRGTGKDGSFCDDDMARFPYVLIESDNVEKPLQLAALCHLRLPIVSIVDSGGKSYHALIRIDATSLVEYRATTNRIYGLLILIGVDLTNKNPSRFTRVPGVRRVSDSDPQGMQSLLYLCPEPDGTPIIERIKTSSANLQKSDV